MPPKESLKLRAYNSIKEKIVKCEYAPNTLLNEEVLREELQVSRTPIRDALSRLEQEGLITIIPKKGIVVSGLSISDINMIFEVRMLYEPYALRHYGTMIKNEVLLELYNQFTIPNDVFNAETFYELDDAFHAEVMKALPNRYLQKTYDWIYNQNLRFRVMTGQVIQTRLENTSREHLAIIEACLKQDWEGAARAMESHLSASKNATFDLLLKNENTEL